jgi:hypothetical protein
MRAYLVVVAIASRLVPRRGRAEWRREWEAEIRHFEASARTGARRSAPLFVHVLGAIPDAGALAAAGVGKWLKEGPPANPDSASQMLVAVPAAVLAWGTMMIVTAAGSLVFGLYFARPGSDLAGAEAAIFFPMMAAIPFGVACVAVYWPAVAALMALTRGRISRTRLTLFGGVLVYPAGIFLMCVGHLMWGREPLLVFLTKILSFPLPGPMLLPHFAALALGGAVFGAFYWEFARDKARARAAAAGHMP